MTDSPDLPRAWILYGAGTTLAPDIAEIVWRRGERLVAAVDNLGSGNVDPLTDIPILGPDEIADHLLPLAVCIPQSTPGHRHAVAHSAQTAGFSFFPQLVDPSAVVARTAIVGRGTVVSAGAVVAARTEVGEFVLVNRSASLGHHGRIDEYASIGPGAVLAGHVTVGRGAFVGAGATIAPGVRLGANCVVGAGAVVVRDVAAYTVVVGNPAKVIRSDSPGFGEAGVP